MNEIANQLQTILPPKQATYVMLGMAIIGTIGRILTSLKNGNGIKGAWRALVNGTNTPTPPAAK